MLEQLNEKNVTSKKTGALTLWATYDNTMIESSPTQVASSLEFYFALLCRAQYKLCKKRPKVILGKA